MVLPAISKGDEILHELDFKVYHSFLHEYYWLLHPESEEEVALCYKICKSLPLNIYMENNKIVLSL